MTVSTKSAKSDKQYVWEGEADTSTYTVREETDPEKMVPRGTVITLQLKVILGSHRLAQVHKIILRLINVITRILSSIEERFGPVARLFERKIVRFCYSQFCKICRKKRNLSTQMPSELRTLSRTILNLFPSPSTLGRRSLVRKRYTPVYLT